MHPPRKWAFSNTAKGWQNSTTPMEGNLSISDKIMCVSTFNPAIPFLGLFQKIYHHKYEQPYTYNVIQSNVINNKCYK